MENTKKCKGESCSLKKNCKRYSTDENLLDNHFLTRSPFGVKKGVHVCDMFIEIND